jgi:hypothetical protein
VTSIPLQDNEILACGISDLGEWAAMDAYRAAFAAASAEELVGGGSAVYHVRQAALETVIADRMRIRAVISIHRALLAGASMDEIAHVLGSSRADVAQRWRSWADGQRALRAQYPGLGLGLGEYERVAALVENASGDGVGEGFLGCVCQGGDTQIGSPRS